MEPDKEFREYSTFMIVESYEVSTKTQQGWELIKVIECRDLTEVTNDEVNPHPPPQGFDWKHITAGGYHPADWTPTLECRKWEPNKTSKFLIGLREEKIKFEYEKLSRELNSTHIELEEVRKNCQKKIDSMEAELATAKGAAKAHADLASNLTSQKANLQDQLKHVLGNNTNLTEACIRKDAEITKLLKEVENLKLLVPPPDPTGEFKRKLDVDNGPPGIPLMDLGSTPDRTVVVRVTDGTLREVIHPELLPERIMLRPTHMDAPYEPNENVSPRSNTPIGEDPDIPF